MWRFIDRLEDFFCAAAILTTALVLFVNVTLRYLFSASTSWAEEFIKYLMIWITFVGGSICVRQGAHIRMDFLLGKLSESARVKADRAVYLLSALFCGSMAAYGGQIVLFTLKTGQVSPALKLPMWIVYLAIPLGCGLMAVRFSQRAIAAKGGRV